jgi:uncharacterized protein YjiS (DUF1127 family)
VCELHHGRQKLFEASRHAVGLKTCWATFQERKRERVRADFYDLNDRELWDIGIARGVIDYVASKRTIDPRR